VWTWPASDTSRGRRAHSIPALAATAIALGATLAGFAMAYDWAISHIPAVAEQLASAEKYMTAHPQDRWWMALVAVGAAPVAEEYLFRGLLFRALDREWGGWHALIGSALFFGVYHPMLAWVPVTLVGVILAILFKSSGRLWPCVLLHASYNAVVTLAP
jgi:membrane protease YdiL (CAAX protease family)